MCCQKLVLAFHIYFCLPFTFDFDPFRFLPDVYPIMKTHYDGENCCNVLVQTILNVL